MSELLSDWVPVTDTLAAGRPDPRLEQEVPESDVSFFDATRAAFTPVSTIRGIGGALDDSSFERDPDWVPDFEEYTKGFAPEYQSLLSKTLTQARSAEHADFLKQRAIEEVAAFETVSSYTGGSTAGTIALMMGASIADPLNLAATLAGGGVGVWLTRAQQASKMTRMKSAAQVAGIEAAIGASLEAPLVAGNPTSDSSDILWSAGLSGVLGAGIGGLAYKAKPGSIAEAAAHAEVRVADEGLRKAADAQVREMAGEKVSVDPGPDVVDIAKRDPLLRTEPMERVEPPEEVIVLNREAKGAYDPTLKAKEEGIDWTVRSADEIEAEKIRAKAIEMQEAKLKKVSTRELGDEPVAPMVRREDLDDFNQELAFFKTLDDQKLSAKDKIRAKVEFNKAKGQFLEGYRDADPEGYQRIFGNRDRLNPPTDEVEGALPEIQKRMEKLEGQYTKDTEAFTARMEQLGADKDAILDAIEELKKADVGFGEKTAGAAQVGDAERFMDTSATMGRLDEQFEEKIYDDLVPERQNRIGGKLGLGDEEGMATRFDMYGRTARSPNQAVKYTNQQLLEDAQTKVDHEVSPPAASLMAEMWRDAITGPYQFAFRQAMPRYAQEIGEKYNLASRALDWDGKLAGQLDIEVSKAIRDGWHDSPTVRDLAERLSDGFERSLRTAKENKLPGWEEIPTDRSYLPQIMSGDKLLDYNGGSYDVLADELSEGIKDRFAEMVYRGLMEANPTFDPKQTARVANAWSQRELHRQAGDPPMPDIHGQTTVDRVNDWMDDMVQMGVLSPVDKDEFLAILNVKTKEPDAGRTARSRFRVNLEMDHKPVMARYTGPDVPGRKHGDMVPMTYRDLLEDRSSYLLQAHANETAGWSALYQNLGIHNEATLNAYKRKIIDHEFNVVKDIGRTQGEGSRFEKEMQALEIGFNSTLGRAITPMNDSMRAVRRVLGGWNFTRVMNQVAFAQVSEGSKIVTATSLKTVQHYMPVMKEAFQAMRNGDPLSPAMQKWVTAAQMYAGLGTNTARGGTVRRYQVELDGALLPSESKFMQRLEHAKKITARPLTLSMDFEEYLGFASFTAEFAQRLKGLKEFDAGDYKRFAAIGIGRPEMKRIEKQLKKYALDERGNNYWESKSEWMGDMQLEKWDDIEARNMLAVGLKRKVSNMVQTNNPGNLPQWSLSDLGQIIAQFRTFMLAAHQKQLMHHLSYGDMRTFAEFSVNAAAAGTLYAAQKYLSSLGREDGAEYRSKMLDPATIARASWERSAWSGLTPFAGDVIGAMTGFNAGNPYSTRSTSLGRGVMGVPLVDALQKAATFGDHLIGFAKEDGVSSRRLFQDAYALMPFSNYLGLSNAAQLMSQALPNGE